MKVMHDQKKIAQISDESAEAVAGVEELAAALAALKGFDGEIIVEGGPSSGGYKIPSASLPKVSGVYKIVYSKGTTSQIDGVLVYNRYSGGYQAKGAYLWESSIYKFSAFSTYGNDLPIGAASHSLKEGTKLYRHSLAIEVANGTITYTDGTTSTLYEHQNITLVSEVSTPFTKADYSNAIDTKNSLIILCYPKPNAYFSFGSASYPAPTGNIGINESLYMGSNGKVGKVSGATLSSVTDTVTGL